jgi:hypothetical protein
MQTKLLIGVLGHAPGSPRLRRQAQGRLFFWTQGSGLPKAMTFVGSLY